VIGCFVGAAVLLPVFLYRSSHHPNPLLDLDLFRSRGFTVGNLGQALFVGSFFGWLVLMPSFFEKTWGWSALAAGFGLAPAPAISGLFSPFAGRIADRIGHRGLVVFGATIGGLGALWWAVAIGPQSHYVRDVLPGSILLGFGGAAGFATLTGAIMSGVPPRFYSMAGAARSTIFQLASAIGIALGIALVGTPAAGAVAPYARAWWMGAIGAFACAVVALALPAHRTSPVVVVALAD
jgi:MFS family permease